MIRWGLEPDHRIAKNDEEYIRYLLKKLQEETEELKESHYIHIGHEIADI